MDQDEQHLQLLSIFHYVLAGILAVFGCFPIIHLTIGIMFLTAPDAMFPPGQPGQPGPPPGFPAMFGLMFTILPAAMMLLMWAQAVCVFLGGRFIAQRKHHTFCLFAAAISCLFMPMGTALGVFSIIVLIRPSVKALFEQKQNGLPVK